MRYARFLAVGGLIVFTVAGLARVVFAPRNVSAADGALLSGTVTSASGPKMGGVTVSVKGEGQTITTTVFTDENGEYYFPQMKPGKYRVWAQADGFGTARGEADLTAGRRQDFTLKPMKEFVQQLSGDRSRRPCRMLRRTTAGSSASSGIVAPAAISRTTFYSIGLTNKAGPRSSI